MKFSNSFIAIVCATFLFFTPRFGFSFPICCPGSQASTYRMTRDSAEILVLGKVIYSKPKNPARKFPGRSVVVITQLERDQSNNLVPDELVVLSYELKSQLEQLVSLPGSVTENGIQWSGSDLSSPAAFQYVADAPPSATTATERLTYFLKFVEHQDPLIAADAHLEFVISPFENLKKIQDLLQRDVIHAWIAKSKLSSKGVLRKGTYYLLLGLCGDQEDAEFLESIILTETDPGKFRPELPNAMYAYLLLSGEQGLSVLDEHKIKDQSVHFSEAYSAMLAIEFMWKHGEGRIPKDRLRQSMRILIDHQEVADLAITDLARWQDWKAMDQLVELYGQEESNVPAIKRAIIRYLLAATKSARDSPDAEKPPHVIKAAKYLEQFRESDPKAVKIAERYFFD